MSLISQLRILPRNAITQLLGLSPNTFKETSIVTVYLKKGQVISFITKFAMPFTDQQRSHIIIRIKDSWSDNNTETIFLKYKNIHHCILCSMFGIVQDVKIPYFKLLFNTQLHYFFKVVYLVLSPALTTTPPSATKGKLSKCCRLKVKVRSLFLFLLYRLV